MKARGIGRSDKCSFHIPNVNLNLHDHIDMINSVDIHELTVTLLPPESDLHTIIQNYMKISFFDFSYHFLIIFEWLKDISN